MKKVIPVLIVATVIAFSYSSCYYDKEDLLYGTAVCDTAATVSYSKNVVPLLQQYCYSCHSGGFPSGNIVMGTYTADKTIGTNGKLYGSITHASGFSPMPQGGGKLNPCQINTIKKWIDGGMLNN